MDEILVKGKDGKWYVLKGGELLPHEQESKKAEPKVVKVLPPAPPLALTVPPKLPTSFSHEGHPLRVELDELVTQVSQDSKLDLPDPILQKRFKTIVSARLRDVRDSAETKAMLLRDQKIGGMGLAEGSGVMEVIEKAFAEFQNKWQAVEKKRIEEWKAKQKQEQEKRTERKIKDEEEELRKRYEKMTGKTVSRPVVEVTESAKGAMVEKKLPPPPALPTPKVSPPPTPTPLPPPPHFTLPKPPPPKAPPKSPNLLVPSPKSQKLTDVRPASRLIGPIEELSSIALNDFRRIAATPQAGVDKIISKIDFLSKESLTRRTEGIKAWQSSPLFKIYSKISATALTGRCSPQSVLERFTTEGQSVLTLEEFYAIMELNQRLRF